jgi:hypothetical protein
MKQFEEKLWNMRIPEKDDIFFEKRLRSQLIDRFVRTETNYLWHYRIAAGIACFFAVFTFVMLFLPTDSKQTYTFLNSPEQNVNTTEASASSLDEVLHYTSIENPVIANELGTVQFDEDKTYLIRRYVNANQETVTIVTEIEPQVKIVPVKRKAY